MKKTLLPALSGALLLASTTTYAGGSLTGKVSTLGLGIEAVIPINDKINARLGYNGFNYQPTLTEGNISYDADLTLKTASAIADYHPWSGLFRLSGGVLYNGNSFSLTGKPVATTFVINGVNYSTADVGSVTATIDFSNISGYFGMGFGNAPSGKNKLSLTFDVGALYQGTPNTTLTASCGTTLPALCAQLKTDAAAEEAKLQAGVDNFKWWPVIGLGISFRF